eukprot:3080221-Rhodomonas_salina.1
MGSSSTMVGGLSSASLSVMQPTPSSLYPARQWHAKDPGLFVQFELACKACGQKQVAKKFERARAAGMAFCSKIVVEGSGSENAQDKVSPDPCIRPHPNSLPIRCWFHSPRCNFLHVGLPLLVRFYSEIHQTEGVRRQLRVERTICDIAMWRDAIPTLQCAMLVQGWGVHSTIMV